MYLLYSGHLIEYSFENAHYMSSKNYGLIIVKSTSSSSVSYATRETHVEMWIAMFILEKIFLFLSLKKMQILTRFGFKTFETFWGSFKIIFSYINLGWRSVSWPSLPSLVFSIYLEVGVRFTLSIYDYLILYPT